MVGGGWLVGVSVCIMCSSDYLWLFNVLLSTYALQHLHFYKAFFNDYYIVVEMVECIEEEVEGGGTNLRLVHLWCTLFIFNFKP